MSKWKIKQVDLALLFELLSTGKSKTELNQIDMYLTSIVIGQKSTSQIAQYMVESWRGFRMLFISVEAKMAVGNIRKAFGWFSESIQTLLKMTSLKCEDF